MADEKKHRLTEEQMERYSRHVLLPQFSGRAQRALLESRVLCIGAGGLGSPALYYLVAAGVGHVTLLDPDDVDLTNLQRQILHATPDVGRPKAESAAEKLRALNPDCTIDARRERFSLENARELVRSHDLVLDGSDNFTTRYLANDACFFERRPYCYGAVNQFEGQASTFRPGQGESPCYRCIFAEPPPPGIVPSCAEAGVLGAVVGQVGVVQATEAIKLITAVGEPLVGRLVLFDALKGEQRTLRVRRSRTCRLCGDAPSITELREETSPAACERR